MDRIKSLFGYTGTSQGNQQSASGSSDKDLESTHASYKSSEEADESQSLISGWGQGVFSKASEAAESLPVTGQDTRYAFAFFVVSIIFFVAALMSLPMVLLSPRAFNLYFCFGSLNLQVALAFWYGPVEYVINKLFAPAHRLFSAVYIVSLLVCFYLIFAGAGYLMSLLTILLQGATLAYLVVGTARGGSAANSFMYSMLLGNVMNIFSRGGDKGGLPL